MINNTIGFDHTILLTQQRDTCNAFAKVFFCCNVNSTNRSIHLFDKHETVNIVYKTLKNIKGCDMCDICYPFGVRLLIKKKHFSKCNTDIFQLISSGMTSFFIGILVEHRLCSAQRNNECRIQLLFH